MAAKCVPVPEPRADAKEASQFGGSLTIVLKDGTRESRFVESPSGEPDNFISAQDAVAKFDALAAFAGTGVLGHEVVAMLRRPELPMADLLDLLAEHHTGKLGGDSGALDAARAEPVRVERPRRDPSRSRGTSRTL